MISIAPRGSVKLAAIKQAGRLLDGNKVMSLIQTFSNARLARSMQAAPKTGRTGWR